MTIEFRVHHAAYLTSGTSAASLSVPPGPEIAFIGRSNVGKSSLLNCLLARKGLVRVSSTPGQTRQINIFDAQVARVDGNRHVGDAVTAGPRRLFLVDLPGFGFAKAARDERARLHRLLLDYLGQRASLQVVVQLFDVRHPPSHLDFEAFRALGSFAGAHFVVATKADKLPVAKRRVAARALAAALEVLPERVVLFSSETRLGREELWTRIWDAMP